MIEKPQEIETAMYEVMNNIGHLLGSAINEAAYVSGNKFGFALFVFPLGEGEGRMNYISNARREDMLAALKEFIARNEGRFEEGRKGGV